MHGLPIGVPALRYLLGLAVSAAFAYVTLSRVDLAAVGRAIADVALPGLLLALGLVVVEIAIRAYRWQALLEPMRAVPYRHSLAYLCVGYFANTLLPARLGDLARAYLAGTAFGVRRLATLGTVLVERVADGTTMLLAVLAFSLLLPGTEGIRLTAIWVAVIGLVGLVGLAAAAAGVRRTGVGQRGPLALVRDLVRRLLAGTAALRRPWGAARVLAGTLGGFATAVLILHTVARAVGLELSPLEAGLVTSGLALSLSIPAAPGALGTYEFVGVAILTGLGERADTALAAVVLTHLVVSLPPAIGGLAVTWALHIRVGALGGVGEPAADRTW